MRPAIQQSQEAHARRPAAGCAADDNPAVEVHAIPVLPVTLLGLELLWQRSALDLRAAARLMRDDPGAMLQLFRLLAEELPDEAERPVRLEECLASVPRERLVRSLARAHGDRRQPARFAAWVQHAAVVGRRAETVAETLGLTTERARLVGLLHELGRVPEVFGWIGWPTDPVICCDRLAHAYDLPNVLRQALDEVHGGARSSVWTAVVAAAHELLVSRAQASVASTR